VTPEAIIFPLGKKGALKNPLEVHSSPCLSHSGTYLPYSTLDTPLEFCASSILIYEAINGYTELAFELVWLAISPFPVRRD
jgi:hypothetical protein